MTQNVSEPTEQPFAPQTFTVADPRTFDGDPYEVAERAVRQCYAVALLLGAMLEPANKMARNAEMERAFAHHEQPQGSQWPQTPQGLRFQRVGRDLEAVQEALKGLTVAAGYNPRRPPKA